MPFLLHTLQAGPRNSATALVRSTLLLRVSGLLMSFLLIGFAQPGHLFCQETVPEVEHIHPPASEQGVFFPFVYNGYLYLFSMEDERPAWRIFIGGDLANPFLVSDQVYFYDIYNRVYAVTKSGTLRWATRLEHEIRGKPAMFGDLLIVATQRSGIFVLDPENGDVLYQGIARSENSTWAQVNGDRLIVSYKNGEVQSYRLPQGVEQWGFKAKGIVSVPPVVSSDLVYIGSWDAMMYALSLGSGEPQWRSFVGESVTREFLLFPDRVVLFFARGEVVCLNRWSGDVEWVKIIEQVDFNYNYFGSRDLLYLFTPELLALDPADGRIIFRYRERAFQMYKDMLFDNMVEGLYPLTENDKQKLLQTVYFSVEHYPYLPPEHAGESLVYFVTDEASLYIFDTEIERFVLKYDIN